ncbi:MAG: hypothetical protein ABL903_15945, partial [Methylococcales bacterium]
MTKVTSTMYSYSNSINKAGIDRIYTIGLLKNGSYIWSVNQFYTVQPASTPTIVPTAIPTTVPTIQPTATPAAANIWATPNPGIAGDNYTFTIDGRTVSLDALSPKIRI